MQQLKKAAAIAAFIIFAGMLIHNLNAQVLEPYTLGFVDKGKDYADMAKIENALWSFSFTSSGITHIVVGFAMLIVGLYLFWIAIDSHQHGHRIRYRDSDSDLTRVDSHLLIAPC